ncbi:MAG: CinA family protein [Candidatus Omnitrophica bacterium]|nr:CinA family protein [Candidatus Omnitrophota bacterium]
MLIIPNSLNLVKKFSHFRIEACKYLEYNMNMKSLEQNVAQLLTKQKKTVSIAESCSGGLVANRLTNIPGSSKYFKAAIVAYSNEIKINQLKIPARVIAQNGAVSEKVALLMAKNIRKIAKTDIGLGITGIAGPAGATKTKPVGLVYTALAAKNYRVCKKFRFKGNRLSIKRKSSSAALKLLNDYFEPRRQT